MPEKKYIFFDIDGTLLPSSGIIPESAIEAIKLAQKNGHEVFINTGRSRNIVPKAIVEMGFDGIVAGTGTFGEYKGEIVFENYFTKSQVDKVIRVLKKYNIPLIMSGRNECVGTRSDLLRFIQIWSGRNSKVESIDEAKKYNAKFFESISPVVSDENLDNYYENHPGTVDFIYIDSPFKVAEINEMLGDEINVSKASFKTPDEFSGEITIAKCSKSTGLINLLNEIGGDINNSIGVGDGFNDVEMLKTCSISIAMGNSPDDIKEMADYVTTDIDDNGIFNALKFYNII